MKAAVLCFTLVVLAAVGAVWAPAPRAETDPSGQFLEAYFAVQEGDTAERKSDWAEAHQQFTKALRILEQVKASTPEWNPHIIEFRIEYCQEHLAALAPKLPAGAPVPTEPSATAPPVPPSAAGERLQQLTADLQRAQDENRKLQAAYNDLNAQLQAALQKTAPAQPAPNVEELLAEKEKLGRDLAAAEKQISEMQEMSRTLEQAQGQIRQLESVRDDLNAKLQAALAKEPSAETNQQVEQLLKQNQDLSKLLAVAQQELEVWREREGKEDEAAAAADQVRLRAELRQAQDELGRTKQALETSDRQVASLRTELAEVRTENAELRRSYDEVLVRLKDADRKIQGFQVAGQKDNEIIRYLRKENALLQEIVRRGESVAPAEARATSAARQPERREIPELKGWRPWRRARREPSSAPAPPPRPPATVARSAPGQMVATLSAPPPGTTSTEAPATPSAPEPAAGSPETRQLLVDARAAFTQRNYDVAVEKYQALLEQEPENLSALTNLGVTRLHQGQIEQAEILLRQAITKSPNDSNARSVLGAIYIRQNQLDAAFAELSRAVAVNPRNAEAHNYLGITLSEKGWTAAAEEQMRKAIELNPGYSDAHFNLAVLYARQRPPRTELARYHYQKALELGAPADTQLEQSLTEADATAEDEQKASEP